MARSRRIIRKLRTVRVLDVEDQLWPIVVTLLILVGFVAGFILAKLSLSEPNLLYNGCTYLLTLSLTCGLLVWAAFRFKQFTLRRTMLFVLLTILVHLWIAMMLQRSHLPFTILDPIDEDIEDTPVARIVFDIQLLEQVTSQNLAEQEFRNPTQTRSPEAQPKDAPRKPVTRDEAKLDPQPVDLEPQPKVDRVQPIKAATSQQSAPKASKTLAKMSRQSRPTDVATRATTTPQPAQSQPRASSNLQAQTTPTDRKSTEPSKPARDSAQEPATIEQQPTPSLAQKRSQSTPTPEASASSPAVKKSSPELRPLPRTVAVDASPKPSVKKAATDAAEPTASKIERADTSRKIAKQQPTSQPTPSPAAVADARAISKQTTSSPAQPIVAKTTRQAAQRSPQKNTSEQVATVTAPAAPPTPTPSPQQPAASPSAAVARSQRAAAKQPATKNQPSEAPSPTAAKGPSSSVTQRSDQPSQAPAVAKTVAPSLARARAQSPNTTVASSAPSAATPAPAASSSPATPSLAPASSSVARNSANQSTPRRASPRDSDSPSPKATAPTARPAARRANQPIPSPTLSATAAKQGGPPKTQRTAPQAATQVAATSSPSSKSPTRSASQFQPSKLSASPSMRGVVGKGRSQNMESNFPASQSPAQTPSTAARRPAPSQQDRPGPSLVSSRPTNVGKSKAQAEVPTAALAATPDAPLPNAPGSHNPAEIDASSSAALAKSDSSAPPGKVTAAVGESQIDFGPVRTVEAADVGRAAGGGEPQVTPGSPTESIARRRPGASPEESIDAVVADVDPVSPGKASGIPSEDAAPDAAPSASEVARADTGGASSPAIKRADEVGPASISDGAGQPSSQDIGRANSQPAPPALKAGDGTGRPIRKAGGSVAAETRAESVVAVGNAGDIAGPASSLAANAEKTAARGDSAAQIKKVAVDAGSGELQTGPANAVAKATAGRASNDDQSAAEGGSSAKSLQRASRSTHRSEALAKTDLPAAPAGGATVGATADASPAVRASDTAARASTSGAVSKVAQGDPQLSTGGTGQPSASRIGRATGSQTTPALAGGGATSLPNRRRSSSSATTQAETIAAAGTPGSNDGPGKGNPSATLAAGAAEGEVTRPRSMLGSLLNHSIAAAGPALQDAPALGAVGRGSTKRATNDGAEQAPNLAQALGGAMLRKSARGALPSVTAEAVEATKLAAQGASGASETMGLTPGKALRADSGVVQVVTNAEVDMGGLGREPAPVPGSRSRQAQENSDVVIPISARINTKKAGARQITDLRAKNVQQEFSARAGKQLGADYYRGQPTTKLEKAIGTGLEFLAKMQRPDGSWSLNHFPPGYENAGAGSIDSDTAATGLALLAFLGASYDHDSDRYGTVVRRGLEFLIRNQKENGDLYIVRSKYENDPAQLYSHGIAAIALCEAYGMTTDVAMLRDPAQNALDFIVASQHPKRGGWRYSPGKGSDTSVTGWQLMALKSGELAGLNVPKNCYELVRVFLARAEKKGDASQFIYNPDPLKKQEPNPNPVMTSVGMLMKLYLGSDPGDPAMVRGAKRLLDHPPSLGTRRRPTRDTYYWYYASQVMAHMGDEYLRQWNEHLKPLLVDTQITEGKFAGSWSPNLQDDGAVKDAWGKYGGRIYVTTMNLLSLEVRHRLLPLYRDDTVASGK